MTKIIRHSAPHFTVNHGCGAGFKASLLQIHVVYLLFNGDYVEWSFSIFYTQFLLLISLEYSSND